MENNENSNVEKKEFKQCPCCGSTKRFFEKHGKELISQGRAPEGYHYCLQSLTGYVGDRDVIERLPAGSDIRMFHTETDICEDCGTVYCTLLATEIIKKKISLVKSHQPYPFGGKPKLPGNPFFNNSNLS